MFLAGRFATRVFKLRSLASPLGSNLARAARRSTRCRTNALNACLCRHQSEPGGHMLQLSAAPVHSVSAEARKCWVHLALHRQRTSGKLDVATSHRNRWLSRVCVCECECVSECECVCVVTERDIKPLTLSFLPDTHTRFASARGILQPTTSRSTVGTQHM
jgi:hypothetical protein